MNPIEKPFFIKQKNLYIVPVCHYQMEYALWVNRAINEVKPDVVAVEYPSTLEDEVIESVKRFPYLSVIFYKTKKEDYVYFPIEPTDPLAEAVRSGLEIGAEVRCIDLDTDDYPLIFEPMPDSYAVNKIGLKDYYEAYCKIVNSPFTDRDDKRESTMAYHLQNLMKENGRVLFVGGMSHCERILKKLGDYCPRPLGKAYRKEVYIFNISSDSIREVTGEIPFIMANYEMLRGKHNIDEAIKDYNKGQIIKDNKGGVSEKAEGKIISLADRRKSTNLSSTKLSKEKFLSHVDEKDKSKEDNETKIFKNFMKDIMRKLLKVPDSKANSDIFSPSLKEQKIDFENFFSKFSQPTVTQKEKAHKFKSSIERGEEILKFYKELNGISLDRQHLILALLKKSAQFYQENISEEISQWQLKVFATYARNYALVTGRLMPDLFQLIACARGCADDNYSYEVWDLATFYPWIDYSDAFRTIDLHADEVWLFGKKITFRRKFPYLRKRLLRLPFKKRQNEKNPGEWARQFDESWICSYPPDDIAIENYSTYLQKKGVNMLSEEHSRVQPFTSSLLDGIDVKETLRNWHEKKIYVKEQIKCSGGVGSVVVIFDEDLDNSKFPWKLTWLGEHHQESDMAFYSTYPKDKIIGPGISRCTYGGFMMTYPPGRVYDVWLDSFYTSARSKSEILLMSAIEYSLDKNIVYVASKPPRTYYQSLAFRINKRVIYIPIGNLSPITIKKIRVFHVLAGHKVREYAKEYVW